jgi:hypothetical protein
MKSLLAALTCLTLLGCASGKKVKILEPELQFVQITGPADTMYQTGAIEVQYGMRIANRSSEAITLKRVQIETIGSGGPYAVPRELYFVTRTFAPGEFADVTFWAHAVATGNRYSIDAQAPVTVRGIAYFESPAGAFRKVFVESLGQTDRGPR